MKTKTIEELKRTTPLILAVDMGGRTAKIGIADMDGYMYHTFVVKTLFGDKAIPNFYEESRREMEKLGIDYDQQIKAVGFGCVGPLAVGNEVSIRALKVEWENYPVAKVAREVFGKPVYVINDARSIIVGEWKQGAGRNYKTFISVSLGTGIGGGIVIDNKLYEGAHNSANEVGHGGDLQNLFTCQCSLAGCPEALSSATGIEKYFQIYIKEHPDCSLAARQKQVGHPIEIKDVADLIQAKDPDAFAAFSTPLKSIAQVISLCIFILDPEAILIGGGPSALGPVLIDALMVHLKTMVWQSLLDRVDFKICELENNAGMVGIVENTIAKLKEAHTYA